MDELLKICKNLNNSEVIEEKLSNNENFIKKLIYYK